MNWEESEDYSPLPTLLAIEKTATTPSGLEPPNPTFPSMMHVRSYSFPTPDQTTNVLDSLF